MNKYRQQSKEAQAAAKRLRSCESKAAYETAEAAQVKNQRVYKCQHCGKFHRTASFQTLVNTVNNRAARAVNQ